MKTDDYFVRVDNRLASVLNVPQNSHITLSEMVGHLLSYVHERKLDDPESNARDDMDPDRHLDHTIGLNFPRKGELWVFCEFCGHHVGILDFATFTCRRCKKRLSVRELTELLFNLPSYILEFGRE